MLDVQRTYDGDLWVPLPELDENERPAVANLLTQGVDQLGMRVSSVLPDVTFPPLRPGIDLSEKKAADRRTAVQGWFDMNHLDKKEARRARYLVAYGMGPSMIKPVGTGAHDKREMPYWNILNPMSVFAAPTNDRDDIEPRDVVIQRHCTLGWLRSRYPLAAANLYKGSADRNGNHPNDLKLDLLEYNDEYETVLIVAGPPRDHRDIWSDVANGSMKQCLLEREENKAGMCLVVTPGRIVLSQLMGYFNQIIGMFLAEAKMTAYENIAVRQGIFPEKWVVSHPNSPSNARIVSVADGKQGVIGEIEGGTIVTINSQPGQMATNAIDRLERSQRVQASIPSDWGGESASNIRTAKRGAQIESSSTDPTLGELQIILAEGKEAEIARAIAVMKGYYGPKQTSFYIPRNGKPVGQMYTPDVTFETDFCYVKYSMPGVDSASIPIELGQRTSTGQMSADTARRIDPLIEDADHERVQVELEGLRTALLKGLEQQVGQGSIDPHEIALIAQLRDADTQMQLEDAVIEAQKQLQAQQAALASAAPGSPETQPGMAQAPPPGAPGAPAGGPPPLAQLIQGLRGPTEQSPAEKAMSAPTQLGGAPSAPGA